MENTFIKLNTKFNYDRGWVEYTLKSIDSSKVVIHVKEVVKRRSGETVYEKDISLPKNKVKVIDDEYIFIDEKIFKSEGLPVVRVVVTLDDKKLKELGYDMFNLTAEDRIKLLRMGYAKEDF